MRCWSVAPNAARRPCGFQIDKLPLLIASRYRCSARGVAEILKRYGLVTVRSNGKSAYRDCREQLKRIEQRYAVDLNTVGKDTFRVVRVRSY